MPIPKVMLPEQPADEPFGIVTTAEEEIIFMIVRDNNARQRLSKIMEMRMMMAILRFLLQQTILRWSQLDVWVMF